MIVLITLGLKIKFGWYVTVSSKKVFEVGKSKKHTLSFKAVPFFWKNVNFLTVPERSCCCCSQFDIGVAICVL